MDQDLVNSDLYNFNKVNSIRNLNLTQTHFLNEDYSQISYQDLYKIRKGLVFANEEKKFDDLNFFTISSKDDFSDLVSNLNSKMWKAEIRYSPLNGHSRPYLKKGDILFCNRIGQFRDLGTALDTRGIYAIGIALDDPQLINKKGNKDDYTNYYIKVGFPCVLQKHLSTRNIQQHPNTIDLTPYNGNRNDALQWIEDKSKAVSLLEMLNVENRYLKEFLKEFYDYDLQIISDLPSNFLNNKYLEAQTIVPPQSSGKKFSLNTIFTGPAGTGKTYHAIQNAVEIVDGYYDFDRKKLKARYDELIDTNRVALVTFHQSFSYEEFVEGIRVTTEPSTNQTKYYIKNGIFKEISKRAVQNPDQKYVLIIDEINRGNVARIFGELITLIEESKRLNNDESLKLILPYTNEPFGVPNNLYIIGTMNCSDRSLATLDIALRRRFEFEELLPNSEILKDIQIGGIDLKKLFEVINSRIRLLIGGDFCIGHAYFIKLCNSENQNIEFLAKLFEGKIIPLLQEYFYDDWSSIVTVLGKNAFLEIIYNEQEVQTLIGEEKVPIESWRIVRDSLRFESNYLDIYAE